MEGSVKRQSGDQPERRPDARRERWRAHRAARRAEFVEAAIRAITRHGAGVGMDEIAAEAGVSKPVLYRHFADKADVYLAVGQRGTEMLMDRLGPALARIERGDHTPRDWIRGAVGAYIGFVADHPELYHFVVRRRFVEAPEDDRAAPATPDVVAEDKALIAAVLSRVIGDYLRLFEMDSGGAEVWGYGLVGMVQAAGDWWLERRSMSREAVTDYLTQIIWHAVDGVLRSGGIHLEPDVPFAEAFGAAAARSPRLRLLSGGTDGDAEEARTDPDDPASTG
ncbi:transcriptional regulator, TetR family [Streptoalloteichus tenebrarius]|uniref:Transcriptional regulator, TetR family n=1 Tax=Streptoalloteichus tenebrarius (strain ATCC 17920 / DSM 40477 / JCM 4838 / CBS 697.72 / NBRC 16177 / NCIMB 11028 / NRRL B-12390 / A12253. 1 / ISP 5477) TaxID=1933 RepID=A0ABT1HVR2_STRSD|nr:TetR/AcrR family transcriptional regulator [Streptoalloteichus tenebrarius]MCP2259602.1 transcriptional regulator, TetR family [Streptoalloteichus tenebrarius]BFF00991.1 TetR/AcrR family transcriptional regulator [Streptoalloteichus tenebrarius]